MEHGLSQSNSIVPLTQEQTENSHRDSVERSNEVSPYHEFNERRCLFCNQTSADMDENLAHMLKAHGLHIDSVKLSVDVGSLLAYFHVIISQYYECLYCGTQRNTRQGVQQHMMAKGHCKYDLLNKDSEVRDFYDFSSPDADGQSSRDICELQSPEETQRPLRAGKRRARSSVHGAKSNSSISMSTQSQVPQTSDQQPYAGAARSSNAEHTTAPLGTEVSARALKQGIALDNQLAKLRAEDRRNLVHLPASQQRALLATQHKQKESATRSEQIQRGHLESAGNHFGCLSKMKLIRKPPHMGHVYSLNR